MIAYNKRTHLNGQLRSEHAGEAVTLVGWVQANRDHGGMVFVDIRDFDGMTQLKFNPETDPQAHEQARSLRSEDVIAITGMVVVRAAKPNKRLPTGQIEVECHGLDILSRADTPPFAIEDGTDANEDLRLRYRFLDLRRPKMQSVLRLRARIARAIRDFFADEGFIEIETPFLTKSTPEGARDYLVPSRVHLGSSYALPQSPQLFKQLFMIAGFDRYAQLVRCFRDEDLRADRQPEFTQVDMEMAFVQADDVMTAVEGCVRQIFKKGIDVEVAPPFPRLTYAECMDRFGCDAPDLRYGMELQDVTDLVGNCEFGVFKEAVAKGGVVRCLVAAGGERLTRKVTDGLTEELRGIGAAGLPLVKVTAGGAGREFSTGIAKFIQPMCGAICERNGAKPGDVIFFIPAAYNDTCKYLHYLRTRLAAILDLIPSDQWNLLWVVDFPLMEWKEEEGRFYSTHHPFTAPRDEDLPLLDSDPGKVLAKAYDLVLNGTEMGGGSIRIHQAEVQKKVFAALGISEEEANEKFQFLMDALRFGAPPHGGIALGFDRWAMLLSRQASLRDVVAFPKTQRAICPLTGAPSQVAQSQLDDLGLDLQPAVKAALQQKADAGPGSS